MPRYLVMVQWGAGMRHPLGATFMADDDQTALKCAQLDTLTRMAKGRKGKRGAKPYGILLRTVKDETPEFGSNCSKCGRRVDSLLPDLSCCGAEARIVRRQMEGTGPEAPYLDLREEG